VIITIAISKELLTKAKVNSINF